jgi:hypothetical protein
VITSLGIMSRDRLVILSGVCRRAPKKRSVSIGANIPTQVVIIVKVLRESGLVRSIEPDWVIRESAEDIPWRLLMSSGTSDAPAKEAVSAH